jgi:hypothetical protein
MTALGFGDGDLDQVEQLHFPRRLIAAFLKTIRCGIERRQHVGRGCDQAGVGLLHFQPRAGRELHPSLVCDLHRVGLDSPVRLGHLIPKYGLRLNQYGRNVNKYF